MVRLGRHGRLAVCYQLPSQRSKKAWIEAGRRPNATPQRLSLLHCPPRRAAHRAHRLHHLPQGSPPAWGPKTQFADLEACRQVTREIVAARKAPHLRLIEGLDLIDHDPKLFDAVAVHPNDQGFAQMGERLARQMKGGK